MKRILLLALFALLSLNADARTLYVNAKRPNNNGNGLSAAKAKKTLQAAINIAKKGDTILVYPGAYAPIKTNNKTITIKSVKGRSKTKIVKGTNLYESIALAQLGKTSTYVGTGWVTEKVSSSRLSLTGYQMSNGYYTTDGGTFHSYMKEGVKKSTAPRSSGRSTKLTGFLLDGMGRDGAEIIGVSGGTVASCTIQRLGRTTTMDTNGSPLGYTRSTDVQAAYGSKLVDCIVKNNLGPLGSNGSRIDAGALLAKCSVSRCRITGNRTLGNCTSGDPGVLAYGCTFDNSLIAKNSATIEYGFDAAFESFLGSSTFLNCTIADNTLMHDAPGAPFSAKCKFFNCILRNNRTRREWEDWAEVSKTGEHEERGYYDQFGTWVQDEYGNDGYQNDEGDWIDYDYQYRTVVGPYVEWEKVSFNEAIKLHNADSGNTYKNTDTTNRNPKLTSAYKLKKGSYCINKGKLTKAQKKQVGATDLAGKKRIKGKAIDRGCYEY